MLLAIGWKTRIGLVLSAIWLCFIFLVAGEDQRFGQSLAIGVLPLIVIWGIVWAVLGWRAQHPPKGQNNETMLTEKRAKTKSRIHTAIALIVIVAIGLYTASWQFEMAGNKAGSYEVARLFGEWLFYGLIAYAIFRFIPKISYGAPAVLAAILMVGAINWKAYNAITEGRQAVQSLARAAPLMNKLLSGVTVSDKDVVNAQIGVLEPLLLAQAAYGRESAAITANYQQVLVQLAPEQILSPATLVSSDGRFQSRTKLKIWQQAVVQYKSQMEAATARASLGIQAALKRMPDAYRSASKGFDEGAAQLTIYVNDHVALENEASHAVTAILDLLDANPGTYAVDEGPPPKLLFNNQHLLEQYRQHFKTVLDVSRREQENHARLVRYQTNSVEELDGLLKE